MYIFRHLIGNLRNFKLYSGENYLPLSVKYIHNADDIIKKSVLPCNII